MVDSNRYECKKCSFTFRLDRWSECSNCGERVPEDVFAKIAASRDKKTSNWESLMELPGAAQTSSSARTSTSGSTLSSDTRAIVSAQNKTTYAVRSLAIFIFTTLCTSLIGYGFLGVGASAALRCDSIDSDCGSGAAVLFGWAVIAIGFLVALSVGIHQLNKSKP